jgi:DNA-binding LytR/AlgR family response regulator
MQKALIIDDERLARNELKKLLLEFPEIEVVGEAANAAEGLEKIENLSPDLIFLDIQNRALIIHANAHDQVQGLTERNHNTTLDIK